MSDDIYDPANPEAAIRQLAFQLWEAAGYPEGRNEEFWYAAQRQLGRTGDRTQTGESVGIAPGPAGEEQTLDQDNLINNVSNLGP